VVGWVTIWSHGSRGEPAGIALVVGMDRCDRELGGELGHTVERVRHEWLPSCLLTWGVLWARSGRDVCWRAVRLGASQWSQRCSSVVCAVVQSCEHGCGDESALNWQ
jgi:hypothetical protein